MQIVAQVKPREVPPSMASDSQMERRARKVKEKGKEVKVAVLEAFQRRQHDDLAWGRVW